MRGETYGCVEHTKIKVSSLTGLQMENKIMFFVIPEMPSKTFVMVLKKLPDHFKELCLDVKTAGCPA